MEGVVAVILHILAAALASVVGVGCVALVVNDRSLWFRWNRGAMMLAGVLFFAAWAALT